MIFNFLCLVSVSAASPSLNAVSLYLSSFCVSESWAVFLFAQAWLLWMVVWAVEVSLTARGALWRLWLKQPIPESSSMPLPHCLASIVRVYCPSRTLVPLAARRKVSTWRSDELWAAVWVGRVKASVQEKLCVCVCWCGFCDHHLKDSFLF